MGPIGRMIKNNLRQYGMVIALGLIMVFFQVLTGGIMFKPMNVTSVLSALSLNAPWNCVTIRLQKPRCWEGSDCSTDPEYYRCWHCHSSAIRLPVVSLSGPLRNVVAREPQA